VSKTSRSACEIPKRRKFRVCSGWSRTTQPRSGIFETGPKGCARWRSLTSRSCFEPQLAETEHVRYVRKPAKHLKCRPATLTKARRHAHGNEFEDLTASGRIFTAKPAETEHVRQVSKLTKHLQCRPAAVAETRRHAHGNELGEPARWKMARKWCGYISVLNQPVDDERSKVRGLTGSEGICHESGRAWLPRLAAFFPLGEHLHSTNFDRSPKSALVVQPASTPYGPH